MTNGIPPLRGYPYDRSTADHTRQRAVARRTRRTLGNRPSPLARVWGAFRRVEKQEPCVNS